MGLLGRIKGMLPGARENDPPHGMYRQPEAATFDFEHDFPPSLPKDDDLVIPFDPATQKVFCSYCGRELVVGGHMFRVGMMCPQHGEFTIAPVVMQYKDGWGLHFKDEQDKAMWETCKYLTEQALPDGSAQVGGIAGEGDDSF